MRAVPALPASALHVAAGFLVRAERRLVLPPGFRPPRARRRSVPGIFRTAPGSPAPVG